MPRVAKDIGPFLLVTSEDTLSLVLETLSVVLEVEKGRWLTEELAAALVAAVLDVWSKNTKGWSYSHSAVPFSCFSDPIFLSIFPDILSSLASSTNPGMYEAVVKQALPPLCNSIGNAPLNEPWVASSAIDLVSSLVGGSPQSGLGGGFFAMLAPPLFKCLQEAEDRDVLQVSIFSWSANVNFFIFCRMVLLV